MKPVRTQHSNVQLTLEGAEPLPAERVRFRNPRPPYDESDGYESYWLPDEGEQRALANGMPVLLRVWGTLHPPVSVSVGEIALEDPEALVNAGHVFRAVGRLYTLLLELAGDGQVDQQVLAVVAAQLVEVDEDGTTEAIHSGEVESIQAAEFLDLWERALRETKTA